MSENNKFNEADEMAEEHFTSNYKTPLRADAFDISNEEKIERIAKSFGEIMYTLGLDMTDDSLRNTPKRVAKAYINELFAGLEPQNMPRMSSFENKYKYNQMLVEKDIVVYSTCEHHFLPIVGKAHVGYISNGKVIGLSKMNRIVQYFSSRPQVQERLTMQIVKAMQDALGTEDVACVIEAKHLCVNSRGVKDIASSTITAELGGEFKKDSTRREFLHYIDITAKYNI